MALPTPSSGCRTVGINPLDYPGRTAMMGANSLGLLASFVLLAVAYMGAVVSGWLWAGRKTDLMILLGRLVFSLIPISIAYHFAHYLGDTLVNLQYLRAALSDPLGSGANFLGLGENAHVTASFLNTASGALAIYTAQTAAIVIGHVAGVAVAHGIALDSAAGKRRRAEAGTPACVPHGALHGLRPLASRHAGHCIALQLGLDRQPCHEPGGKPASQRREGLRLEAARDAVMNMLVHTSLPSCTAT